MSVHIGKKYSDHFECGLCEFVAKDEETLEIHCQIVKFTSANLAILYTNIQVILKHTVLVNMMMKD